MKMDSFFKVLLYSIFSFLIATQSACVVESISGSSDSADGSSQDGSGNGGEDQSKFAYDGCVDGQGVGTKSIQINFLFPDKANKVRIKRNGNQIAEFSKANATTSHIDDDGLREGATYLYTCEALVDGLWAEGKVDLQLSTLAVNAPAFSGIDSATAQSPNSVLVKWTPSISDDPVSAFSYQIFANVGDEVDWTAVPRATVLQGSPAESLIENLGDELKYAFGVRACSEGDICETNTKQEFVTNADGGKPTTEGATALEIVDGKLMITAPWTETQGGILRRYVYIRKGATGGLNIGDYTLERTYILSGQELYNPPQTLEITPLEEGQTYHVIVQDEDPSSQRADVVRSESIVVTDVTPPSFGGITNIANGSPEDSVVTVSWTAIDTEANDPVNGGDKYRILSLESGSPIATNPCLEGTMVTELDVSSYTAGNTASYDLTGLQEKTYYSICIKAVDLAGNVSSNSNSLQINTLDITAPDFLGVQSISYDNQSASLNLSWNASTAPDILEYKITLWVNQATPPASPTVLVKTHAEAATGTTVSSAEFPLSDNDEVYAIVEACDSTEPPFGSKNCSATGIQKSTVVPDVTPPPNFIGIKGPTDIETPSEGTFTVKWNAPADWSDYRGFKVYQVDPSTANLTLMKTCPCADYGCSDQITQCTVGGLEPYRTFRLHVRAYDEQNNETLYLDPTSSYTDKRTSDTTAPTFASNLVVGVSPGFELSWNAGVDNQYAAEPGAEITYKVYQNNQPFDFSNPSQPDGNLKTSTTDLVFQDSGFVESETYYYTVCASDASGNTNCDQLTRNFTVPDVTVPTITNLTATKTVKGKVWELEWDMEDNISTVADLYVEIRRKISVNGDLASNTDEVVYSGLGSNLIVSGTSVSTAQASTLDPLSGTPDENRKINYLVMVRDEEGNEATANTTIEYKNQLTITSVKGTTGPIAGGKVVAVYGTGFSSLNDNQVGESTTVTIAGKACTSVEILSENSISCLTPSVSVSGSVEVRVKQKVNNPASAGNNAYSEAALTNGYTYSTNPILCDNPGAWGPSFAAGDGTSIDPYVVCNVTHLDNIRPISDSGAYFKLGDSIDLQGVTFLPLGNATKKFTGSFDGDGHLILNWTYNDTQSNIGFLGYVLGDFQVSNLGVVNVNITAAQSVSGVIGTVEGGVNKTGLIDNVFVTGSITADDYVGGLIGRKENNYVNFNMINSYFVGDLNVNGITGYGGGIGGFLGSGTGGFFQNVYAEGTVTGTKVLGGLFGNLGEGKQILDSFARMTISASGNKVGGLAAEVKPGASITNSFVDSGSLSGVDSVGGAVGLLEGSLDGITTEILVTSSGRRGGGVVGYSNAGTMNDLKSLHTASLNNAAGGLVGEMVGSSLTNSYATEGLAATGSEVGGLVGKISGATASSITKSYSKGLIETTASAVGGLVGSIDIVNGASVAMDEIFSESPVGTDFALPNQQYGGLVGKMNTQAGSSITINNCFASGAVQSGSQAGGLLGGFDFTGGSVTIDYCYSVSPILGGTTDRGGVFGKSDTALITINNTFWDTEVSTKVFASGNGAFTGTVTGKTTAEMLDYNNSIYTGWDFTNTWLVPAEGYPQLKFAN